MKPLRVDRVLSLAPWPDMRLFEARNLRPGDVLIVSGGFEDRALGVLRTACAVGIQDLAVIGIEYSPAIDQNHYKEVAATCKDIGWKCNWINYDRSNPRGIFEKINLLLPLKLGRIYVDISGMSRLLIVQMIVGLLHRPPEATPCSILYTVAEHYPPTEQEARAELEKEARTSSSLLSFISTGVFDLAIVPELASTNLHQAPVRLIAFPSFNPTQLLSVRSSIQPSQITLIHGTPPDPKLHWRTEVITRLNKLDDEVQRQDLTVSTLDYSETLRALLQLYDRWAEFNTLMLSPTGSKMQTVAAGIFRAFMSDIQIIYPTPLRFTNPDAHTRGIRETYELELDLFGAFLK